jgi:hypothetical protein
MKHKIFLKLFFVLMILASFSHESAAQFFIRGGYSLGMCNPKEINRVVYIHNQINSGYYTTGSEMQKVNTLGGIHIAMGTEMEENSGFEMSWSNKHHVSKADFIFNGETIHRYLKVRTNNFSIGFYGGSAAIAFGGSLDFGNMKGFYKRAPEDSIKSKDYVSVFQNQLDYGITSDDADHDILRTAQMGFTPFIQLRAGPAGLRLFYQWQFKNLGIDNLDNKLLTHDIEPDNQLQDRLSNFGLLFFLQLGGYK